MENGDKKKKVIDLRRFFESEAVMPDENGSYTGMPAEFYNEGIIEKPVQDADDL